MENEILDLQIAYFREKILEHGATPRGVDWNSIESQEIRFSQVTKVIDTTNSFSVLDYGCGYGAMYNYLSRSGNNFRYTGFDISTDMLDVAIKNNKGCANAEWTPCIPSAQVDYTVASGIFNVRLHISDDEWKKYILDILHTFDGLSTKGFSFNMLTMYSDKEYMKDYLYYADPAFFFDYCKKHFSKYVALLHDYPLYEYTIIVRK